MYAHENRVTSVQVSPDGAALASASWDCNIKVTYFNFKYCQKEIFLNEKLENDLKVFLKSTSNLSYLIKLSKAAKKIINYQMQLTLIHIDLKT